MNKFAVIVHDKDGTTITVYTGNQYLYACCIYDDLSSDKNIFHVELYDCFAESIIESR